MHFQLVWFKVPLEELREEFDNRPWVHDNVKFAFFDKFFHCFSGEDLELKYTDAEINADVIRSLVPDEFDVCPGSHTLVWPPSEQLCLDPLMPTLDPHDPAYIMDSISFEWLL